MFLFYKKCEYEILTLYSIITSVKKGARQILERKYIESVNVNEHRETIGYKIAFYKKRCKMTLVYKDKK